MIEWWYWIVLGVILSVAEIFILGFFVIWLGISAILVGIISFFILFPLSYQIMLWAVGSVLLLWVWFGYLKGNSQTPTDRVGQSDDYQGVQGEIIKVLNNNRYKALFEVPILGDREWIVESDEELQVGDKIFADRVYGQLLRVKKVVK